MIFGTYETKLNAQILKLTDILHLYAVWDYYFLLQKQPFWQLFVFSTIWIYSPLKIDQIVLLASRYIDLA